MEHREFMYVGDKNINLTENENAEFLLNFQKAILIALEKKQLLTRSQRERCYEMIESRQLSNVSSKNKYSPKYRQNMI